MSALFYFVYNQNTALAMPYHVYILYSKRLDRFYVGVTSQLQKRILQHNNKESAYTSTGVPWMLLWYTEKATRSEAEKLERKLKNLRRSRKIRFMQKYSECLMDQEMLTCLIPV